MSKIKNVKEKSLGLFGEFKEFIKRGNVLDMAIGVVIGGAFSAIVTSLVNDIIMPLIAVLTGDVSFENLVVTLKGSGETAITLNYGLFIQTIVNFIIIALVLFFVVKAINKVKASKEEPAPEPAPAEPSDELKALNKIVELLEKKK